MFTRSALFFTRYTSTAFKAPSLNWVRFSSKVITSIKNTLQNSLRFSLYFHQVLSFTISYLDQKLSDRVIWCKHMWASNTEKTNFCLRWVRALSLTFRKTLFWTVFIQAGNVFHVLHQCMGRKVTRFVVEAHPTQVKTTKVRG